MDSSTLAKQFARIGASLRVNASRRRRRLAFQGFAVDIAEDNRGPFFDVMLGKDAEREAEVLDIQAADRHLLLLVRDREVKHKFLCGHDERDWFVAAVPETTGVGTIRAAMEALKPEEVLAAQARKRVKGRHRNRRRNAPSSGKGSGSSFRNRTCPWQRSLCFAMKGCPAAEANRTWPSSLTEQGARRSM